jgi:crotonobetainyl-CoA:carnitine CoA-transferase CaiB-like acyl-CoA transferase
MDNRGKRSLVLDLGRAAARQALDRVLDRSDVLLTNLLHACRATRWIPPRCAARARR